MFNVLSAKCKDVPDRVFMMSGGLMSIVIGFTYCWSFPNANFVVNCGYIGTLALTGMLQMLGILFIRLAATYISPALLSMIRTFEIVMALVLEICIARHEFDFSVATFHYKVIGSLVVTLSAIAMAMSDKINALIGRAFNPNRVS